MRALVVGSGNIGRHHARVYSEIEAVELVGIVDPAPESEAIAESLSTRHFRNLDSAFDTVSFDIGSVCVPTDQHVQVARSLLLMGVSVLVEKPVASDLAAANELMNAAESSSALVGVGHVERYNPVVSRVRDLIAAGAIGDVLSMVSKRVGGFPRRSPKTDVVLDLAVHDIDLMTFLVASDCSLLAAHGSRTIHAVEPDAAELLMRVGTASGFVQANWVTPVKIRTLAVTGTAGYLEANYVTQELIRYELKPPEPQPTFNDFVRELGYPVPIVEDVLMREPLRAEIEAFVDAVRRRDASGIVSVQEATRALTVALEAARLIRAQLDAAELGETGHQ